MDDSGEEREEGDRRRGGGGGGEREREREREREGGRLHERPRRSEKCRLLTMREHLATE